MPKPRVFISHINKESDLAQTLKKHLSKDFLDMIDVFVSSDATSIPLGSRWLDDIDAALKETQVELILCSSESVKRPWVNFEAGAGWIRGIPVIPICHSGLKPSDLPIPLSLLQSIEASNPSGIEKLYMLLAQNLGSRLPSVNLDLLISEIKSFEVKYRKAETKASQQTDVSYLTLGPPNPDRLLNMIKRIAHVVQGDYADVKKHDWKIVYSLDENGDDHSHEEFTLITQEKLIYFYFKDYNFINNSNLEAPIRVSSLSMPDSVPLMICDIDHSDNHVRYAIFLDPPSTVDKSKRIALKCDRLGLWKSLLESGEDQGYYRSSYESSSLHMEFVAPPGRRWVAFHRVPEIGDVSLSDSQIVWRILNPPARRYSYRIFLK